MKKNLLLIIFLFLIVTGTASARVYAENIKTVQTPSFDFEARPIIIKKEPFLPIKPVLESLGWKIIWDSKNKTVQAFKGENTLIIKIGSNVATINGNAVLQNNPPVIIKGISYVSSRFIAQEFGTKVRWNRKDNLIIISNRDTENIKVSGQGNIIVAGDGIIVNIFEPYGIDIVYDQIDDADQLLSAKKPQEAVTKYKNILENISEKENPNIYCHIMNNMGNAYNVIAGFRDTENNSRNAISAYSNALRIYSSDKRSKNYFITLNNLGNAYFNSWELSREKADLMAASDIYVEIQKSGCLDDAYIESALIDYNTGMVYDSLGKKQMAVESFIKAQNKYLLLLKKVNKEEKEEIWALLQYNLGNVLKSLSFIIDREKNAKKAVSAYENALTVMTVESYPLEYAQIHKYMGDIYKVLSSLDNNKREYALRAIEEYTESLKIYTSEEYPVCNQRINLELETIFH
ncbi:copper amine oxidase N-terminal domain-containing protein [Ruminiclostridium cellulolyticum]|uniref:Copper amine oxidase domain protein n=1 Tax=Ruminiclostridium cellulolyticum (strain ATCC 35319 / DSM 5812 / JCM 6584 / H10) TaxID=394503 RepID=B8I5D4_RUMCH|nr:copper amine oxidase N-terminal domain-containing protein [Ruminiclostridium cellulolyticum]ACL76670.1 copper amine oxidase domain protein [Ruminiclostridium cellulolyticum H10]